LCRRFFFGSALESILSSVKRQNFINRGHFNQKRGQIEPEDRGQISKIEDSPLKNQADGQPTYTLFSKRRSQEFFEGTLSKILEGGGGILRFFS